MRGDVTGTATVSDLAFGAYEPMTLLAQNPAQIGVKNARTTNTTPRDVRSAGCEKKFGLSEQPRELTRQKLSA